MRGFVAVPFHSSAVGLPSVVQLDLHILGICMDPDTSKKCFWVTFSCNLISAKLVAGGQFYKNAVKLLYIIHIIIWFNP